MALFGPVSFDRSVQPDRGGNTLLGGSPFRVMGLTPAQRSLIDRVLDGPADLSTAELSFIEELIRGGLLCLSQPAGAANLGDIDLVIPCRNHERDLRRLLSELPLHEFASVVVIDDGSSPPVGVLPAPVQSLRRDDGGPGAARQTGAELGSAPLVLFLDADVFTTQGEEWGQLFSWFACPKIAAVAPRVRSQGSTSGAVATYERSHAPFDLGSEPGMVVPQSRLPFVPSAALGVRRSAFEEVGGFDTSMTGGEDVDLVWRLDRAGWWVRFEPKVSVEHRPSRSWLALARQRFGYGKSNAALADRHPGLTAPAAVSAYSAASWLLCLFGRKGIGVGVALGIASTVCLAPKLRDVVDDPVASALRLAGGGTVLAGDALAAGVRRAWLPFALVGAAILKPVRVALAVAVVIPPIREWCTLRPPISLPRWVAQRSLDDLAFGGGVAVGALQARSAAVFRPRFVHLDELLVERPDPSV